VLPGLLGALTDPEGDVRGAAAFALGQFSEYLQPDITHHHQAVLPAVFRLLQDPSTDVQERACYGEAWERGQEGCWVLSTSFERMSCSIVVSLFNKPKLGSCRHALGVGIDTLASSHCNTPRSP
jgi:hypothetical protein